MSAPINELELVELFYKLGSRQRRQMVLILANLYLHFHGRTVPGAMPDAEIKEVEAAIREGHAIARVH